jgi:hypothetical protein
VGVDLFHGCHAENLLAAVGAAIKFDLRDNEMDFPEVNGDVIKHTPHLAPAAGWTPGNLRIAHKHRLPGITPVS